MALKDTYKGSGSLEDFVENINGISSAINNATVTMPSGYAGKTPTLEVKSGALVLDMKDAQVFSPNKVNFTFIDRSTAPRAITIDIKDIGVVNGFLTIRIEATGV